MNNIASLKNVWYNINTIKKEVPKTTRQKAIFYENALLLKWGDIYRFVKDRKNKKGIK